MKFHLTTLVFLASLSTFANDLHCVSSSRTDLQVTLQGQVHQGTILTVQVQDQNQTQQLEILVDKIKPFDDHVEIIGLARNQLYVGGGQLKFQLILPFKDVQPALLRTSTPVFNRSPRIEEIQMACSVQNLYQIPPSKPVLATR